MAALVLLFELNSSFLFTSTLRVIRFCSGRLSDAKRSEMHLEAYVSGQPDKEDLNTETPRAKSTRFGSEGCQMQSY